MYAIIQLGSAQFKVSEGDLIAANRLPEEAKKKLTIDQVLMYADGEDIRIGQPYLKDVKVSAEVVDHPRGEKTVAFKYKRRKGFSKKTGHRQDLTTLNITKIAVK